jgi:hypothetical protein
VAKKHSRRNCFGGVLAPCSSENLPVPGAGPRKSNGKSPRVNLGLNFRFNFQAAGSLSRVIPRESGVSSTPRLLDSIANASEYWIARLRCSVEAGQ